MNALAKKTKVQLSKDIFPTEAWELISNNEKDDDLVIIDVSTPYEYKDRHLEGAINVNLFSRFFKNRLDVMDKSRTYVIYCKVGGRSKIAKKVMHQLGFRTVYNILGGTLLWEEEGLPFGSGTEVVFTDKLFELDRNLFGVDEMPEPDINTNAQEVATKIVRKYFNNQVNTVGLEEKYDLTDSRQTASSCAG